MTLRPAVIQAGRVVCLAADTRQKTLSYRAPQMARHTGREDSALTGVSQNCASVYSHVRTSGWSFPQTRSHYWDASGCLLQSKFSLTHRSTYRRLRQIDSHTSKGGLENLSRCSLTIAHNMIEIVGTEIGLVVEMVN